MNYILFGGFLVLLIENRFKPRIYRTKFNDWVIWYNWAGKRKFWKI